MRRGWRRLRWYVGEFTGENAYERYVARVRSADPRAAVESRRDFERRRVAARYADPRDGGAPCC
jgi:uncharacterized short protein YbdD (DUF466 family)